MLSHSAPASEGECTLSLQGGTAVHYSIAMQWLHYMYFYI